MSTLIFEILTLSNVFTDPTDLQVLKWWQSTLFNLLIFLNGMTMMALFYFVAVNAEIKRKCKNRQDDAGAPDGSIVNSVADSLLKRNKDGDTDRKKRKNYDTESLKNLLKDGSS